MHDKCMILAEPSKLGRRGVAHMAEFEQADYLVSSQRPGDVICAALEKHEITLYAAD